MANALHRSSDVANFDTYPSEPQLTDDPNRLLAEATEPSPLEGYGAQLGTAAGTAVSALRRAQQKVRNMTSERGAKITDIASARLQEVGEEAASRAGELGRRARAQAMEWRRQMQNGIYRARLRAREVQHDYPIQVVIGAGLVGLLIGAGLRIWRSHRA